MLLGDLNVWILNREDFIVNDVMYESNLNYMEIIGYEMDFDLLFWVNLDNNINDNGIKLLIMCKLLGIRILNGWYKDKMDRDFIFMGFRGFSVVDYCVLMLDIFGLIEKFQVVNFIMYFDYVLLYLQILICFVVIELKGENNVVDNSFKLIKLCKWKLECLDEV